MTKRLTPEERCAPLVEVSQEVLDKVNSIQPTKEGLREAMLLMIPLATKLALTGNASWAKYLLDMAHVYLPEWKDKKSSNFTPDDYYKLHTKLTSIDTSRSDEILLVDASTSNREDTNENH